MIPEENRLA